MLIASVPVHCLPFTFFKAYGLDDQICYEILNKFAYIN